MITKKELQDLKDMLIDPSDSFLHKNSLICVNGTPSLFMSKLNVLIDKSSKPSLNIRNYVQWGFYGEMWYMLGKNEW